jgi:hypothetical protein
VPRPHFIELYRRKEAHRSSRSLERISPNLTAAIAHAYVADDAILAGA